MRYRVGDKVRVRKDLKVNQKYGDYYFTENMKKYEGKIVEIEKVRKDSTTYHIKEDEWSFYWNEEMLEPVITNFDKVKEELKIEDLECGGICGVINRMKGEKNCIDRTCEECRKWLKQPYKPKEILDEKEKEYLSAVIKPFRYKVLNITCKYSEREDKEYIMILLDNDHISLPYFKKDKMYKGMEIDKKYTLEDLGL